MISHLPLRLAASLATLAAVAAPHAARCQAPAAAVPATRLANLSVVATGKGSPAILIPGLSTPRETWAGLVPDLARRHRVLHQRRGAARHLGD